MALSYRLILYLRLSDVYRYYGKRKPSSVQPLSAFYLKPKKPDWVKKEIIRMKAFMPDVGSRKLADNFNRRYANKKKMIVGETYVSNIIKQHQYEIQILRKKIINSVRDQFT